MEKNKIIVFGNGDIAQLAHYYFETDSDYEVVAFTVDQAYLESDQFEGKPNVPFEEIVQNYPPSDYKMFVAISYSEMNATREEKFHAARKKGYELVSYVSSSCTNLTRFPIGKNCFILENNVIQPFVKIEDNVTLWSGNHIGHHSTLKAHCFISSHVVVSGHCVVESNSFLGINCTIQHNITIGEKSLIGAGAIISKYCAPESVYVPAKSKKLDRSSLSFEL